MAHKRKGQLTTSGKWAKHLRGFLKREFWKGERKAEKELIRSELISHASEQVATYRISDTFKLTGRGIVFAGLIMEGVIRNGDSVEFLVGDKILKRKIIGIEGIRHNQPEKINMGLLIKCENENEIEELRIWEPKETIATVYQINERIKLWADFNASSDFGLRLNCFGTIKDLERQNLTLEEGMKLLLWDEDYNEDNERDDLVVEAIARYNSKRSIWEGEFEWDDIKHESELNNPAKDL